MSERLSDLESEIKILKNDMMVCQKGLKEDIQRMASQEVHLPTWIRNSAAALIIAVFTQIFASVWWASAINTHIGNIYEDVKVNTEFRSNWPKEQSVLLVTLSKIETHQQSLQLMLAEVKQKLRFVDIQQQNHPRKNIITGN